MKDGCNCLRTEEKSMHLLSLSTPVPRQNALYMQSGYLSMLVCLALFTTSSPLLSYSSMT